MPVKKVTKKVVKKNRINPLVPKTELKYVKYEDLDDGDCFLMRGNLWMECEMDDQVAVELNNGDFDCCLCDEVVIPVNVTINWEKKSWRAK